jgi:hypothetical protein
LDNVSEPELLSESQLAVLPEEPWDHVAATTRLGGSVAMIELDRLNHERQVCRCELMGVRRDAAVLALPEGSSQPNDDASAGTVSTMTLMRGWLLASRGVGDTGDRRGVR